MPVFMPEAIGQIGGAIELAAANVNLALGRLAKRNDSRVETMNQRAERQKVEGAILDECSSRISCSCSVVRLGVVAAGRHASAAAGPVGVEELAARLVDALVGVGAEVVALGLQQVRGQPSRAVAVEEGERGRERRRRDAGLDRARRPRGATSLVLVRACSLKNSSTSRFDSFGFLS